MVSHKLAGLYQPAISETIINYWSTSSQPFVNTSVTETGLSGYLCTGLLASQSLAKVVLMDTFDRNVYSLTLSAVPATRRTGGLRRSLLSP